MARRAHIKKGDKVVVISGASKSEALRQAQLGLVSDQRFRHPSYWAPFLLIGNWL